MKMQRRQDLELRNIIQIIVEADCNDGDYVIETNTMPYAEFVAPAFTGGYTVKEYVDLLRKSMHAGRDWIKFCQDATEDEAIGDYLNCLVPANIHDGMQVSISSIAVLFHNTEGCIYEVL